MRLFHIQSRAYESTTCGRSCPFFGSARSRRKSQMYTDAHLVPGALRRILGACAVVLALLAIGCTNSSTPTPTSASLSITKTHTGNFTQGQNGATYTVTVSNAAGAASTSGTVTVTETVPTGMTLVTMAGTGWTCATNTCTRADALA